MIKNSIDKNAQNWEMIYNQKKAGNFLIYPSEHLVSLFFQNKSLFNLNGNCLDFGFGSANNSEFLIQQLSQPGQLYGLEIAESSLLIAQQRLNKYKNFSANNFKISSGKSDFDINFFDLVIAWQMLCYNNKTSLISTIAKLHNYLKRNGILICTLTTHNDVKVKYANLVAEDTYEVDSRIPHQEGCHVVSPKNKEDFVALFHAFDVIDVGYYERASFIQENSASEYYLIAKKK